jgi:signal transduction histidine kinase/DNA-binding response OmpR family regulator
MEISKNNKNENRTERNSIMKPIKKNTLLTIDNDSIVRQSVRAYFEDRGFDVLEANNGAEGLAVFHKHRPNIVLIDINMAGMDGVDVIGTLAQETPETPLIVVSDTGNTQDAIMAMRRGAWDYVSKPIIDMRLLMHIANRTIEQASLLKENRLYQEQLESVLNKKTKALRDREMEISAIYDNTPLAIILLDKGLRIRKANNMALKLTAGPLLDTVGHRLGQAVRCIHSLDTPGGCGMGEKCNDCIVRSKITDTIKNGVSHHRVEASISVNIDKKQTNMHMLFSSIPMRPGDDDMSLIVLEDITEQKDLELQLRQAQKMEAVGRLAGGVAHDFNNLLQVIQGYGELSLADLEPESPIQAKLEQVLDAAGRATKLIRQLMVFSRREAIDPERANLKEIIDNLIKMLRRVIGEQVELDVLHDTEAAQVFVDPGQIEQVVMNLCINSRDAMPEGGRISINTSRIHFDAREVANRPWAKEGGYSVLTVSDNGCGMPSDIRERIFEPFFTTKDCDKGSGLGLATVYAIVQRHSGGIEVCSEPGQGTTFRIFLPIVHAKQQIREKSKARISQETQGAGNILLAEDDEHVRDMVARVLKRGGYTTHVTTDGVEAIEAFQQNPDVFDMVVLDVVMPGKSGRAVHDSIRAIRPELPILMCSG